jgi:hypothetical protein
LKKFSRFIRCVYGHFVLRWCPTSAEESEQ